jgi:hypothetical protein
MESPLPPAPVEPRRNNTTLIIAVVAAVVLCCCCIAVVALWQYGDALMQSLGLY